MFLCSKKEKDLLQKVQSFANQLQQYRFDSENSLTETKENAKKQEQQLQKEISSLQKQIEELEFKYNQAKTSEKELMTKKDSLEIEIQTMKEKYTKEISEWKHRFETEQKVQKEAAVSKTNISSKKNNIMEMEKELNELRNVVKKQTAIIDKLGKKQRVPKSSGGRGDLRINHVKKGSNRGFGKVRPSSNR